MTSGARHPGRVVPWTCQEEWEFVMAALYAEGEAAVQEGCRFVRMWEHRGRIPTAVEATGNLALMRLQLARAAEAGEDLHVLRLAATMALVRFVNEMVDPGQKGAYAQPITRLAEQIGLPRTLVDLRHSGTHDELPSVGVLQLAIEQALAWLLAAYWRPAAAWEGAVRDKCRRVLALITAELGEPVPGAEPAAAAEQKRGRVVAKHLNTIDHLEVSRQIQAIFAAALQAHPHPETCRLAAACLGQWTRGAFAAPAGPPAAAAVSTGGLLDETEAVLRRLQERKRPRAAPQGWHRAAGWEPCDLGAPISFRQYVQTIE